MATDFSALVENIITCPVCLRHYDEPRMLPCAHTFCLQCIQQMTSQNNGMLECPKLDGTKVEAGNIDMLPANQVLCDLIKLFNHRNTSTPLCYRCETGVAEHWCDGDCKHCFCSRCWDVIHELGQYQNHTKLPVSERPDDIIKCQDHDVDDKAKYWCEICFEEICNNCQQLKHQDHRVTSVAGDVKPLDDERKNGLQTIQLCLSYRSNRTEKLITEIEEESKSNQEKVTAEMATLRQLIDEHERTLLENIQETKRAQNRLIEEYKRQLQGEQHKLIKEILGLMAISQNKQLMRRRETKTLFDNYIRETELKLIELRPRTRIKHHLVGLDRIREIEAQIRNIKLEVQSKHKNDPLQQQIVGGRNQATLNLANSNLNDLDMKIVAQELEINRIFTKLQLYANEITDTGAQHLADALRLNQTLTNLELHGNQIGPDGLEDFADVLRTNTTLKELYMAENQISDSDAECIANGLATNKDMKTQIRNVNVARATKYENAQLQKRLTDNEVTKINVSGAGSEVVNGIYVHNGIWDGKAMFSNRETGFDIWFKIWGQNREWRIGKTNDYWYINLDMLDGDYPPAEGWQAAESAARYSLSLVHRGVVLPVPKTAYFYE